MSVTQNVIYTLDSRLRNAGGTINAAVYNVVPAGTVLAGTYELVSFQSTNQVYNVETGINDLIVWDEVGSLNLSVVLPAGHYATQTALATAVDLAMTTESAASGQTNTYTTTYSALTGKFSTNNGAGADFNFDWLSQVATTNLARELLGYSSIDNVAGATQVSDNQVTLVLHQNIVIDIAEDSQQNVHLLSGAEHSLIVPLNQAYQIEMDSLRDLTYSQTVVFAAALNQLNVSLFTEDGIAPVNFSEYILILRRLF